MNYNPNDPSIGPERQTILNRWPRYEFVKEVEPYPIGGCNDTYAMGMAWLDGHGDIADWGCGLTYSKQFVTKSKYIGIDGSWSKFCDKVADLRELKEPFDCIFMRHVLDHNWQWKEVITNAVNSFQKRMVLILFVPLNKEKTQNTRTDDRFGPGPDDFYPYISFLESDLLEYIGPYLKEKKELWTGGTPETLYFLEK